MLKKTKENEFILLKKEIEKNGRVRLSLKDREGYKYYVLLGNLGRRNPRITDKTNIYSIYNIKRWLSLNKKTVKLLSDEYIDNNTKMLWQCECGATFSSSWNKIRYKERNYCKECSKKHSAKKRSKSEKIINDIQKKGYKILTKGIINCDAYIDIIDKYGYKYNVVARSVISYKPKPIVNSNPYVIENIKNYIIKNKIPSKLLSNKYTHSTEPLLFECSCGNKFYTTWQTFCWGNKIYCSKCSRNSSKLENKVRNYLIEKELLYEEQKSYDECYFNIKGKLRFDFCIYIDNKAFLIEVNGIQHYKPVDFFGGIKGLKYQKERDKIKRKFCLSHNIPLLEIPYNKFYTDEYKQCIDNFINT